MSAQAERPERSSHVDGRRSLRLPSFVALSCLLHAALHAALSGAPAPHASAPAVHDELEISLHVEPAALPAVLRVEPDLVLPAPTRPRPARKQVRVRSDSVPRNGTAIAQSEHADERSRASGPGEAVVAPTRVPDLSPQQVARAFVGEAREPPARAAPEVLSKIVGSIATNESVARSLRPQAVESAREPVLTRRSDGGYNFQGNGFRASIRRDGSLVMNDQYGHASAPLVPMQLPNGEWRIGLGGASFDLGSYMEHLAGNDPFRSERRWFLDKTRALRESLAEKAADASTRARLARIWNVASLSLAERKRSTFAAWDECTEDSVGQHGRTVIERYVREECTENGPRGFTRQELSQLNGARKSRATFAPYARVLDRPDASN